MRRATKWDGRFMRFERPLFARLTGTQPRVAVGFTGGVTNDDPFASSAERRIDREWDCERWPREVGASRVPARVGNRGIWRRRLRQLLEAKASSWASRGRGSGARGKR